ncbi:hypothetical protein [Erythrobacter sp.]|jgi:hypothetical protein|uniref:hypothetical protein n=1 Tax=Erythrobacter sp. TaxID=1042 RepID=UPI002EBD7B2B|nr:hypothetical protein [Erythrobacter sp.]
MSTMPAQPRIPARATAIAIRAEVDDDLTPYVLIASLTLAIAAMSLAWIVPALYL